MQDKERKDGGEMPLPMDSANDMLEVDRELAANTGQNRSEHPRLDDSILPLEDEPGHARGGVGGRTSPRRDDDSWTPGEGSPGMGSHPSAAIETVAADEVSDVVPHAFGGAETSSTTANHRDAYAERMRASLEERGIEIEQLTSEAGGVQASVRKEIERQVESVRGLQKQATERLEQLTSAGNAAWQEATEGMDRAYGDLKSAIDNALSAFRQKQESGSDQEGGKATKP